jgi:hypothetical protein
MEWIGYNSNISDETVTMHLNCRLGRFGPLDLSEFDTSSRGCKASALRWQVHEDGRSALEIIRGIRKCGELASLFETDAGMSSRPIGRVNPNLQPGSDDAARRILH